MSGILNILVALGGVPLSASAVPATVSGTKLGPTPGTATSNATTVTATGGDGAYTYSWAQVSGDTINCASPTSNTTTFSAFVSSSQPVKAGTYRCTVTDTVTGATATADVDINLYWDSGA